MEEKKLEFEIDNTQYEIQVQFIFVIWAYLFLFLLFFMVANSDIKAGITHTYGEFFISQLTNGRFLSMLLGFFIFVPILLYLEIKKIRKRDNVIYFKQDGIYYKDSYVSMDKIKKVEICWYCVDGGFWKYLFLYLFMGFMSIPFRVFELTIFYSMKLLGKSDLKQLSYKFGIFTDMTLHNGSSILYGYCYNQRMHQKLLEFEKRTIQVDSQSS
jgi:hypothetical protein